MTQRNGNTFISTRHIAATPEKVFAAIHSPERLARWWGPAGFTNTVQRCDMRPGGHWVFDMHSPDGKTYQNENVFETIDPPQGGQPGIFVLRHIAQPLFRLTLRVQADGAGTQVDFVQVLDSAEMAQQLAHIVEPANEQNLDRLTAEVLAL